MSVINTNVSSLIAQNAISSNSRAQSNAMQQLSSGLRINGAKDDAAGLSIASKMTSQIRGLDQAVRNANDAISLMQTADSSLVSVSDMMQRMRELAVQGASDTNVASDRTALNAEFTALRSEISRTVSNTQWNGMNILDGSAGTLNFQVGAGSGQTISKAISNMGFGTASTTTSTAITVASNIETATSTIGGTATTGDVLTFTANGAQMQYTVKAADSTATLIATAVAAAMNTAVGDPTGRSFASRSGLTITTGAATVTMTGLAANVAFAASSSSSNGTLASVSGLDVTTQGTASGAIAGMDTAIASINSQRSDIGATINRLTYASDNLANVSQNAQASRSRIQDTDYAKTSTELARTQIIAQAATAMLAQANQSQQSVLALLK